MANIPVDFDYIVVGGGSAGCVLANRLSASGEHSVCLLEAGPDDGNPLIRMPMGILPLVRGWFANWAFWSEPQQELGGRLTYQPRGKVLGGSSSINAMVCTRGHRRDYDHWAELGCEGWAYEQVLPYFRKSENFDAPLGYENLAYHGQGGPLNVTRHRSTNPICHAFVEAGQQAGYRYNADFNGAGQEGFGFFNIFQQGGQRCSNARAYLTDDVRRRHNLTILTRARAHRVLLDGKTATGVRAQVGPDVLDLHARREVILSAGALQSPQLLMLSGIGPKAELEKHGIDVVLDAPGVGANLQDHLEVIVETKSASTAGFSYRPIGFLKSLWATLLYLLLRRGALTSNGVEAGAFIKSDPSEEVPDLQLHFAAVPNLYHGMNFIPMLQRYAYVAFVYDCRPLSRGRVGLYSANPGDPPLIDPRYLTERRDIDKLVKGVRLIREVLAQPAFRRHREIELSPGPQVTSDEQLEHFVREKAETTYHPVGTCRMGIDPLAVVDPQLRVRGMKGLRVADASIMPTIVGANTNAPTTMIAEKAADLVLNPPQAPAGARAARTGRSEAATAAA